MGGRTCQPRAKGGDAIVPSGPSGEKSRFAASCQSTFFFSYRLLVSGSCEVFLVH